VSETLLTRQTTDYERIARAITFITSRVDGQPSLEEIAADQHLSPFHFQRLFSRWAGVTPKRFLQVLTVDRAKRLMDESRPLLEVSNSLGLSSGSRLYDHFVQLEAITPGEYKTGGEGLTIEFGVHETPFGMAFVAATPRGVCNLAFLDAVVRENHQRTGQIIDSMFAATARPDGPLSLHVSGTNFQINVWRALLDISSGAMTSYSEVAARIGRPKSARAVGRAVGTNPVAFLIPCHRVIQQSGELGGYHWGVTRKQAIHAWEAARSE
jgi:AraC family transcriptional regulator of adaptative response/methylated-DNA-[protein]-cysteine methyltransferase